MDEALANSTPNIEEFNPYIIPIQHEVIKFIRTFDYTQGVLEVLLSGSYGSAKSILMAHIGVTHVLLNPKSRLLLGRKAMPDLRDTIFQKLIDHMEGVYIEGEHFEVNQTRASIKLYNGSEVISRSWHDKKYKKFRSLELSAAIIEELTENSPAEFDAFYKELYARVGRLPNVKENFVISATNPDAPSHPAYKRLIQPQDHPRRKVFYSRTDQNPFLPKTYIEQIKEGLTAQEVRRYIYGEWVDIKSDVVYYAYDPSKSAVLKNYEVNQRYPIYLSWDFNIGEGKPMSMTCSQYIDGKFLFFDEVVIHGSRTLDTLEELNAKGILDYNTTYIVQGDATGKRRDTRSIHSDYEIITKYLSNLRNDYGDIKFYYDVPTSNPPVRTRHSIMNGQLCNAYGMVSIFLDPKKCPMLDDGLRSTKLKKGGSYIEDDSQESQHITTSASYHVVQTLKGQENGDRITKRKIN